MRGGAEGSRNFEVSTIWAAALRGIMKAAEPPAARTSLIVPLIF